MSELSIYEKAFLKTSKTDAILVVDGKKLHVNKALLSCHSDYFDTLFNSEFKEKSMEEIEIKDVDFEQFATLLSLIHTNPIAPTSTVAKVEEILDLADRFLLPAARSYMDFWIISSGFGRMSKLELGNKYNLPNSAKHALSLFQTRSDIFYNKEKFKNYSVVTKAMIYDRLLGKRRKTLPRPTALARYRPCAFKPPTMSQPSIYEKAFAKTDKTDAILVVQQKKMHVNKALLSYHSDYFNTLFNSEFKEKLMEEIEIKDVQFEKFAALLSIVQEQPIALVNTVDNYRQLLTLADRFLLRAARNYIEVWIMSTSLDRFDKLRLSNEFNLHNLTRHAANLLIDRNTFYVNREWFKPCKDATKAILFDRLSSLTF